MQGRAGYMFSRLFRERKRDGAYLAFAKSALDFAAGHCIDERDGRMYFTVTEDGRPLRKRRYYFSETFYIIANAEYYRAMGDTDALARAVRYYDFVTAIYRDPSADPYKITPKTYASTRDMLSLACPMILLNVAAVMREAHPEAKDKYDADAKRLTEDIFRFRTEEGLMLESVCSDGTYLRDAASARIVNPGHSIELSWFLADRAAACGDRKLLEESCRIFDTALRFGWDERYGGILYFKDREGMPVEAYEHDMKLWWPHNEAAIASLKLLQYTGDEAYFDVFRKVADYMLAHFPDPDYGEWFGYLRRDGLPTEPPCKGHTYKGPFHVLRMLLTAIQVIGAILEE